MGVGECSTQTIVCSRPACSTTASYSSHAVRRGVANSRGKASQRGRSSVRLPAGAAISDKTTAHRPSAVASPVSTRRTRARTVTDQPSLLARIERAIYRLQNTHGLPLQSLGEGCDPEVLLRDCADDHVHMCRVLCELREAVQEQVGEDQTDRLRGALSDAVKALSA